MELNNPYPDYSGPCYSRSISSVKDGEISKPLLLINHADLLNRNLSSTNENLPHQNGYNSSASNDALALPLAKPTRKTTQREIILILTCIFLIVILTIVTITMIKCIIINYETPIGVIDSRILYCLTASCLRATAEITEMMAADKRAVQFGCENLEEFACGDWTRDSRLPPTNIEWNLLEEIRHIQMEEIRNVLESDLGNISSDSYMWKFQMTFEKCMGRDLHLKKSSCDNEANTDSTISELIKMPNLQTDSLDKILQHVQINLNVPIFFKTSIVRDYSDTSKNSKNSIILLSEYEAEGLPDSDELQDPAIITMLSEYIKETSLAADLSETHIRHLPDDFILTLKQLRKASIQSNKKLKLYPQFSEIKMNITELGFLTNHAIDFAKYLAFFKKQSLTEISSDSQILLSNTDYFKELSNIILQTKLSNLKNFILFSVIHKYGSFVSQTFSNAKQKFIWRGTGRQHPSESWQDCIELLNSPGIAGIHYLSMKKKPNLSLAIKRIHGSILFYIRGVFISFIDKLKISEYEKEVILEKISEVKLTTLNLTSQFLNKYYRNWIVTKNSSLLEIIQSFQQSNLKFLSATDILMKVSNGLSSNSPLSVYVPESNSIVLSNILLQWPFYSADESIPKFLEFASLGLWLANPIIDIISYKASLLSINGSVLKQPLNTTLDNFDIMTLIDQKRSKDFSNFKKLFKQNDLTKSILIVQLLESAYENYQKDVYSKEHILPHLNYSAKQILFIRIAQNYCSKLRPDFEMQMYQKGLLTSKDTLKLILHLKSFREVYKCSDKFDDI